MPLTLNFRQLAQYPAPVRIFTFMGMLLVVWLPFALPVYGFVTDPNWQSWLSMPVLYAEFLGLAGVWGRWVYGETGTLSRYGLWFNSANGKDLVLGLGIGYGSVLGVFLWEGLMGWITWRSPQIPWFSLIWETLLVSLLIGFAEETLFRGWLLSELERDYSSPIALWGNAIIFALAHFIKPWDVILQLWWTFPSLVMLGLALVWSKWRSRSAHGYPHGGGLGLPIGLHGGLVGGFYLINVGSLVHYTGKVPPWMTGIDNNPLAGGIGMIVLTFIALTMYRLAYSKT